MPELLVKDPPARPRYRLLKPFYADDNYIAEGVEIEYGGVPNEQMEPLNESAKARMTEFLKLNGGFTPRIEDITYQRMQERPREITLPHTQIDVPLMGTMPNSKPAVAEPSVTITKVPAQDVRVKKLMGTVVQETSDQGDRSI